MRENINNSSWKQERLPALRLRLGVLHVLFYLLCLGVLLIICGSYSYFAQSYYPPEISYDYTDCVKNTTAPNGDDCTRRENNGLPSFQQSMNCTCHIEIMIDNEDLLQRSKLIVFYEITEFHQNLRRYKSDVDWNQLGGRALSGDNAVNPSGCQYGYYKTDDEGKIIFPCGKVAAAYFSDVFTLRDPEGKPVALDPTGIAWSSDLSRFKNPPELNDMTDISKHFGLPKSWHNQQKAEFITPDAFSGKVGVENERFIVWMRASAFHLVRNKYAYTSRLKAGKYQIEIKYRYEVTSFQGRKRLVIAAESYDHPVNSFFYIWCFSVAGACIGICPLLFIFKFLLKKCWVKFNHLDSASCGNRVKYGRKMKTKSDKEVAPEAEMSILGTPNLDLEPTSNPSVGGTTIHTEKSVNA